MLSDGELMTATCQDVDKVMFHAAQLSLGALGVIVSLKLQCEPDFNLEQLTYAAKLEDVSIIKPNVDCILVVIFSIGGLAM